MKEKFLSIFLMIFLVGSFAGMAYATMIGSPTSKGKQGKITLDTGISCWEKGFEWDENYFEGSEDVEGTRILFTPTYGVTNQVDVFLRLGLVDSEFDVYGTDINTDMSIAYGFGGKVTFLEANRFRVGAVIQLLMWSGDDDVYGYNIDIDSLEIDIAVGTEYKVDNNLSCYGGLMLGKADADIEISSPSWGSATFDAGEEDLIGLFGGANYKITDMFGIGLEARLITEMSLTVMADFSF